MSPRPQKVSDEQLFAAAMRAMSRLAPHELTLAEIASEAGVTAGLLVQRFGSKRDLMLRMTELWAGTGSDLIAGLRKDSSTPLAALRAYARCLGDFASSPAAFVRSLAYLQIDLSDADLRRLLAKQALSMRKGIEKLLAEAVSIGELRQSTNVKRLARTIEAIGSGSLMVWAHYQKGSAAAWVAEDMEAVIEPYLVRRRR